MPKIERVIRDEWVRERFTKWDAEGFDFVGYSGGYNRVEREQSERGFITQTTRILIKDVRGEVSYHTVEIQRIELSWDSRVGEFLSGVWRRRLRHASL